MEPKVETFAKHPHWPAVLKVIERLSAKGHKAYLAGGCVRDALLGHPPKDFDIATDALPDEVERSFHQTVPVGKDFGVILVICEQVPVEVTTFRVDGDYRDGRRPERVEFRSAEEDARRRDFTVNALFYDVANEKVIDYVGGMSDLKARLIRTVGEPRQRFTEDKLRILRGVRFAAVLGFAIEPETLKAMTDMGAQVRVVARERINDELKKICDSTQVAPAFHLLKETRLYQPIFGEFFAPVFTDKNWAKFFRGLTYLGERTSLTAVLSWLAQYRLHHLGQDAAAQLKQLRDWLKEARVSGDMENAVKFVARNMPAFRRLDTEALLLLEEDHGFLLLQIAQAEDYAVQTDERPLADFIERYATLAQKDGKLPPNWLNGEDLIQAGLQKGPRFGEILREARLLQLERKLNSKAEAMEWLRSKV